MMMPHSVSKKITRLVHQLQTEYGDYAKYTDTLDRLHTLIINDAQTFKPKRTYKKKKVSGEASRLVGTPSGTTEVVFPDDRVDTESGGQE